MKVPAETDDAAFLRQLTMSRRDCAAYDKQRSLDVGYLHWAIVYGRAGSSKATPEAEAPIPVSAGVVGRLLALGEPARGQLKEALEVLASLQHPEVPAADRETASRSDSTQG